MPENTSQAATLSSRKSRGVMLLCVLSPILTQGAFAQDQAITLGAYRAQGDYGEALDTKINYLPLGYELNRGNWSWQVVLPLLQVTGLGNVLVNVGGVTQAVAGNELTRESGMGDAVLSSIYHFEPIGALFIDLRVDAKLPTADEGRALGTGETDIGAQIDLSANAGSAAVFASLGYNYRGKTELYPGLKNSLFAQLGYATALTDNFSLGIFYDFRQPASGFSPESHELAPYFSWQFSERWSFTGMTVFGFTDASADQAVLGQLRYSW